LCAKTQCALSRPIFAPLFLKKWKEIVLELACAEISFTQVHESPFALRSTFFLFFSLDRKEPIPMAIGTRLGKLTDPQNIRWLNFSSRSLVPRSLPREILRHLHVAGAPVSIT